MLETGGKFRKGNRGDVEYMPKKSDMKELESEGRPADLAGRMKSDYVEKQSSNANEYGANDIGSGRIVGHLTEMLAVKAENSTVEEILEMRGKVNTVEIDTSKAVNMTMVNIRRMLNPEILNKKAAETKMKAFREVMVEAINRKSSKEKMNTT